jgi:hypothetical protein
MSAVLDGPTTQKRGKVYSQIEEERKEFLVLLEVKEDVPFFFLANVFGWTCEEGVRNYMGMGWRSWHQKHVSH